jgi:hypothetical protein
LKTGRWVTPTQGFESLSLRHIKSLEISMISRLFIYQNTAVSPKFSPNRKFFVQNDPTEFESRRGLFHALLILQIVIEGLHTSGGVLLHLLRTVRVNIERECCCCVAEQLLNGLNISAGCNGYSCGCVAEVVDTGVWPSDSCHNLFEMT